jgi:hypothetical protein
MRWSKKELDEISEKDFAIRILQEQKNKLFPDNFKYLKLGKTIRYLESLN